MAESGVTKEDKEGEATLFDCPMFQNYQARARYLSDLFSLHSSPENVLILNSIYSSQRSGDDNYVMNLELPTLESPETWVLRGVALLSQEPKIS